MHTHSDLISRSLQAIQYPAQSHYPDTDLTSPCHILMMSNASLGSDKHRFWCDSAELLKNLTEVSDGWVVDNLTQHTSETYRSVRWLGYRQHHTTYISTL